MSDFQNDPSDHGEKDVVTRMVNAVVIRQALMIYFKKPFDRLLSLWSLVVVALLMLIALFVPEPTPFQEKIWAVGFALGIAVLTGSLPGSLAFNISGKIKTTSGIAVFVLILFLILGLP